MSRILLPCMLWLCLSGSAHAASATPIPDLPPEAARRVASITLLSPSDSATFWDQIAPGQSHEVGKGHRLGGDGEAVVTRILQDGAGSAVAARGAACAARDPCG